MHLPPDSDVLIDLASDCLLQEDAPEGMDFNATTIVGEPVAFPLGAIVSSIACQATRLASPGLDGARL